MNYLTLMRLEMEAPVSYRYLRAKHPSCHANNTRVGVPEVLLCITGCILCSDKAWAPVDVTTSESLRHLPDLCLGQVGSSCGLSGRGNLLKCRVVHGGKGLCLWEGCCTVWGRGGREQKERLALKPWCRPGGELRL